MLRDAFVLGAGFSKAISHLMPSTNELGESVLTRQRSIHDVRATTHSSICNGLSCDWPSIQVHDGSAHWNFEAWISTLAQDQPHLLQPENDRRRALFAELTGLIAVDVESRVGNVVANDAPPWLVPLIAGWHTARADVVTFNYDTLVEAALELAKIPQPDDPTQPIGHVHLGPTSIPWWDTSYEGRFHPKLETFNYYKLHGSTDWYWDETTRAADSIVEIGLRYVWDGPPRFSAEAGRDRAPGKAPMIVPPTTTKTGYFDNPVIRHLWHSAYLALTSARRIFVIGYSLPVADILVRSMLEPSMKDAEVWVINPDPEVEKRFRDLEPGSINSEFSGRLFAMDDVVSKYVSLI